MIKNSWTALVSVVIAGFWSSVCVAGPTPADPSSPVELGVWHSNLAAATAKAKELKVPMLVMWGSPTCGHCKAFDIQLDRPEFQDYLANRGLVMVYEKTTDTSTDIKKWVGRGDYPLVRITWWTDDGSAFRVDYKWQYPKTYEGFRDVLESKISDYVPGPLDSSKDAYDDGNDTVGGAAELTWTDQVSSESLQLATKTTAPVYEDKADWFKLAVVTGKTYKIWITGVTGVSADAPKVALFGDAGATVVIGAETALASGNYEFVATANGYVYVRIQRATAADAMIKYVLNYQRWAPGRVEFSVSSKSVYESSSSVSLTLRRTEGTSGAVSVRIGYVDSGTPESGFTATAGSDFTATEKVFTWADGNSANQSFSIPVNSASDVWEGNETFGVTLSAESSPGLDLGPMVVVTILEESDMVIPAGKYYGWVGSLYTNGVKGTFAMTVSTAGRISGRVVFPKNVTPYSGTYTLASMTYETISNGVAWLTGELAKSGADRVPLQMQVTLENGAGVGSIGDAEDVEPIEFYQDKWTETDMAAAVSPYVGYYTVAFPVATKWPDDAPAGAGYAGVTVDKRGRFKAAGKLGDGTTFSQSGVLFLKADSDNVTNVCALLYSAPTSYKGGLFAGVIRFADVNTNGVKDVSLFDEAVFVWRNFAPFSVSTYDSAEPGFESSVMAVGGWYDKTENLATHYQNQTLTVGDLAEPPELDYTLSLKTLDDTGRVVTEQLAETAASSSWQATSNALVVNPTANGAGFTVAGADLKLQGVDESGAPVYNYDTAVNPNGLSVQFSRATGVMAGKFNIYYDYPAAIDATGEESVVTRWVHVSKKATYKGVILPERPDLNDGVEGDGYYLFPGKAAYETATGTGASYSFNYSFEFLLEGSAE